MRPVIPFPRVMPPLESGVLYFPDQDCTRVWVLEPRACGVCNAVHVLFVNRGGTTRCSECDRVAAGGGEA